MWRVIKDLAFFVSPVATTPVLYPAIKDSTTKFYSLIINIWQEPHSSILGVVFAVVGVIESVASFGSPLLLGILFAATVEIYPGLTFFVLAGMNIIPIFIIMWVTIEQTNYFLLLACNWPIEKKLKKLKMLYKSHILYVNIYLFKKKFY